jgi:translation initiation factor 3 subunit L
MVHIAESTVGRRYAGWFIKNAERTQKIFDDLRNMPLPTPPKNAHVTTAATGSVEGATKAPRAGGQKVAWGGVKIG